MQLTERCHIPDDHVIVRDVTFAPKFKELRQHGAKPNGGWSVLGLIGI